MNNSNERLEVNKVLEHVARHASFSLGKQRILDLEMMQGKLQLQRELERLDAAMMYAQQALDFSFSGVSDITQDCLLAQKSGMLSIESLVHVTRVMQATERLRLQYTQGELQFEALNDLFESLNVNTELLRDLTHTFSETYDVLDRASAHLRDVRISIKRCDQSLQNQIQSFLKSHSESLVEPVVTMTQGRPTFLMKLSDKNKYAGTVYGTSSSGQSVYFEPQALGSIQNEIQILKHQEALEIERLCMLFSNRIGNESQQLLANLDTLSMIDALFAKALWGLKMHAVVPTMNETHLYLEAARHPLIDPKKVVANTFELRPPYQAILISGPNTGGKSVSLKTMGLACVMGQMALPICADVAEIKRIDQVFVDMGDHQSIEQSLSSFSAHLKTLNEIIEKATPQSLVLLDELGSQTDPLEGESLAMAVIDAFRALGCFTIATTHFGRLKQYGSSHEDILMASVEFDLKTLAPTYKYRPHVMGESNALAIAKRLGLRSDILDNAFKYKQEGQYEADHLIEKLEAKIQETDALKLSVDRLKETVEQERKDLESLRVEQVQAFEQQKITLETQYQEKISALVDEAQSVVAQINESTRPDFRNQQVQVLKKKQQKETPKHFKIGDHVRLIQTGQVGVIETLDKKGAEISIRGLKMKVKLNQIEWFQSGQITKPKKKTASHHVVASRPRNLEINVIGQRAEPACAEVSKFIDQAVLQHLSRVRVIHGHGTGALRTAIHDMLRRNKSVESYALAGVNEGGVGATIVTLKS